MIPPISPPVRITIFQEDIDKQITICYNDDNAQDISLNLFDFHNVVLQEGSEEQAEDVEYVGFLVSCANLLEKQAKVCYAENTTNCTRRRAKFMEKRCDNEKQMVQTNVSRRADSGDVLRDDGGLRQ